MRTPRRNLGFTLFEVVIAALIIAGGVMVVAGVLSASSRQARSGGAATQAPLIAQEILETHRATQAGGGNLTCGPATLTREHNNITYTINQVITPQVLNETNRTLEDADCPTSNPDAFSITLDMTWTVDGVEQSANYTELISTTHLAEPRIEEFTATSVNFNTLGYIEHPTDPNRNEVTLTWDVPVGGQPLDISITSTPPGLVNESDLPPEGSITFNATQSAMLTLTAENPAGVQSRTIPVTAVNSITSFTVQSSDPHHPDITGPLSDMTLNWELRAELHPDLEVLTLTRDFPAEGLSGSTTITDTPNPTTRQEQVSGSVTTDREITYTLQYSLRTGEDLSGLQHIETRTVSLDYLSTPVITQFSVAPNAICPPLAPQNLSLLHTVQGGVTGPGRLVITAPGYNQPLNETTGTTTRSVPVGTTTSTYTLTATNNAGRSASATSTLTVHPPPTIVNFTASDTNPTVGVPYTLAWNVTGSSSRTLNSSVVAASGNQVFTDSEPGSRTYTLRAVSAQGCPVEQSVTVNVEPLEFTSFNIAAPTTGSSATTGDTLNYSWATNRPVHPTHHKVELLRNGSNPIDVTNRPNGTITLAGTGEQNYQLRITPSSGASPVYATSPTRTITSIAVPDAPVVTPIGLTATRMATVGDTISLTFTAPGINTSLHTLQRQFPGGSWTNTTSGTPVDFTSTRTTPGSETINYRLISRNDNRVLREDSLTVNYVSAPTLTAVTWNREDATTGDQLTITAEVNNLHPDLHQLQRRLNPNGTWENVNHSTTQTLTSTAGSNYQYRIINKLEAPAPSAGRQYASGQSSTVTVHPVPTLNACTVTPSVVTAGEPVTINGTNTGVRSDLHTLQWRRANPSATTWADFSGNSITTTTPAATGTLTYELRVANRHPGTFTNTTRSCTVNNVPAPGNPTATLIGTHGTSATVGDTVRVTFGTPSSFNSSAHRIQYQLPGGSWTNTSPGTSINYTGSTTGNHTINLRVISTNTGSTVTTGSVTINFGAAPNITSVNLNRTTATAGDTLTITATITNFNSNLHQLQRRQGSGAWSNVTASSTINPTSTANSVYEYRVINRLAPPAPSAGRQYSSRSNSGATIYPAPTLNNCSISATLVQPNQNFTITAVNSGFRSNLHTLQWRRSSPSATSWANFTGNSFTAPAPNISSGGTATYQVRVANRYSGTFTNITRSCSVTVMAIPNSVTPTISPGGNKYGGDTVTLSWPAATNFNASQHSYAWRRVSPTTTSWSVVGSSRSVTDTVPHVNSPSNLRYELRIVARNSTNTVLAGPTASANHTVRPLPTIRTFNNLTVSSGQAIPLSWTTNNYVNADFYMDIRRTNSSSYVNKGDTHNHSANPITHTGATALSTGYQVRIRRNDGRVVATATNTVTVHRAPVLSNLTRSVSQICTVQTADQRRSVVSWSLPAGMSIVSVTANNGASVSGSGNSRTITVANNNGNTVTVTVRVRNAAGATRDYTTTISRVAQPSISRFTINNTSGNQTHPIRANLTLRWTTANSSSRVITLGSSTILGNAAASSNGYSYRLGASTSNQVFRLTARGNANCADVHSNTITVTPRNTISVRMVAHNDSIPRGHLGSAPANAYSVNATHHVTTVTTSNVPQDLNSLQISFNGPVRTEAQGYARSNTIPNMGGGVRIQSATYAACQQQTGFQNRPSTLTLPRSTSTWSQWTTMGVRHRGENCGSATARGIYNRVRFQYTGSQLRIQFDNTSNLGFYDTWNPAFSSPRQAYFGYRLNITLR